MEAHRLAGEIDYILKVRVKNARAYDAFYQALISEVKIFNVTALLSMEEIKFTTIAAGLILTSSVWKYPRRRHCGALKPILLCYPQKMRLSVQVPGVRRPWK